MVGTFLDHVTALLLSRRPGSHDAHGRWLRRPVIPPNPKMYEEQDRLVDNHDAGRHQMFSVLWSWLLKADRPF